PGVGERHLPDALRGVGGARLDREEEGEGEELLHASLDEMSGLIHAFAGPRQPASAAASSPARSMSTIDGRTSMREPIARQSPPLATYHASTPATSATGAARSRPTGVIAAARLPYIEKMRPCTSGGIVVCRIARMGPFASGTARPTVAIATSAPSG